MDSSTRANTFVILEDRDILGGLMINDSGSKHGRHIELFVSDTAAFYFNVLVTISLCACVSIFGIVSNIINIIVFIRQGIFKDGGSPSLLGLAVSDLCCVISMLWLSISHAITLCDPSGLSWNPWDITYLAAGWPHLLCAQITRMATAFVAFERCICVVFPFKVKSLLTPRRSIIIIACMFVFCGLSYSYAFILEQFKWRADPETNTSRLVIVVTTTESDRLLVSAIMYYINTFCNSGSVIVVFLSTMITVSRVQLSKTWRKSMTTGHCTKPEVPQLRNPNTSKSQTPQVADHQNIDSNHVGTTQSSHKLTRSKMQKEMKLIRMIIFISIVFLICYLPDITFLILNDVNEEISIHGTYGNLAQAIYSFTFSMETINSSINIVIYYKMSSRYKQEFRILFGLK